MNTRVAMAIAAALCIANANAQTEPVAPAAHGHIRVHGEGVVVTRPDEIVISLGVETVYDQIESTKRQNAAIVVAAISGIKRNGIEDDAIRIDQLNIEPRYRDPAQRQGIVSYIGRNAFSVTVDHPAKVEPVVSAALQAGVNYLHGIDYRSSALAEHQAEARQLALQAARDKANGMASALERRAGRAVEILESTGSWSHAAGSRGWGAVGQEPGNASLGEIAVRASVTVTFELLD